MNIETVPNATEHEIHEFCVFSNGALPFVAVWMASGKSPSMEVVVGLAVVIFLLTTFATTFFGNIRRECVYFISINLLYAGIWLVHGLSQPTIRSGIIVAGTFSGMALGALLYRQVTDGARSWAVGIVTGRSRS